MSMSPPVAGSLTHATGKLHGAAASAPGGPHGPSLAEHDAAIDAAWMATGVYDDVRNGLDITG
jgi:hypothetical protein